MITDEQLQKYAALWQAYGDAERAFHAYAEELTPICDHPAIHVKDYRWEHDTGYGLQTQHVGSRCAICGATSRYKDGRWYRAP